MALNLSTTSICEANQVRIFKLLFSTMDTVHIHIGDRYALNRQHEVRASERLYRERTRKHFRSD